MYSTALIVTVCLKQDLSSCYLVFIFVFLLVFTVECICICIEKYKNGYFPTVDKFYIPLDLKLKCDPSDSKHFQTKDYNFNNLS